MNIIVIKENLRAGIAAVERALSDAATLPILKNILLETVGSKIKLTATNLELAISSFVPGKILSNGRVAVPGSTLASVITTLPGERITCEAKSLDLEVKTDNYTGLLPGANVEEFPIIPKIKNINEYLEVPGTLLRDALVQVLPAAQYSDLRPELSCVLFFFTLDSLVLAATDSFRLAEKTIPANQFTIQDKKEFTVLIPLKTIQEMVRIIKSDGLVRICVDENQVLFTGEDFECISRLNEGTFPDYQAILPKEFMGRLETTKDDLINGLRTAGAVGNKNNEVQLRPKQQRSIEIFAAGEATGRSSYLIPAKLHDTVEEVVFNWKYLLDGLKSIKSNEVVIGLNKEKPALIHSPKDPSFLYILAPIINP